MEKGIVLNRVFFGYEKEKQVLKGISYTIRSGTFLGLTGVNGSGKTTFTYLLNGLIPHFFRGFFRGEVRIDGVSTRSEKIDYFAQKVGMVFQNPDFSLFNLTVAEEVAYGLRNLRKRNEKERVKNALTTVGLADYGSRDPQTLSFGEKQKVCLASVLALDTSYLVLDEPTAMLDYRSAVELYTILKRLHKQGKTIIVVEHDTDFLLSYSQETIIMDKGKIVLSGKSCAILSDKASLRRLGIKIPANSEVR